MKDEVVEYRTIANTLRDTANAADKVADMMEKEECTAEELGGALKDFAWQLLKLSSIT